MGEICYLNKGKGYSKRDLLSTGTPIFLYGRLYTKYEEKTETIDTFAKKNNDSVISTGKEVVLPDSGETARDIARASWITKPGTILAGGLLILKPKGSINSGFLAYILSYGHNHKLLASRAQGKTIVHIHLNNLDNLHIIYPIKKDEQTKIEAVLNLLNKLLSLQQRKLDLLKQLKKGLLQKMFADRETRQPVLRFNSFTGDWEQRKLGNVSKIVGGGTPSTKIASYWNGEINWYTPAEISDVIYTDQSERTITEEGLKHSSARLLPAGTLLFTSRAGIGKTAILSKEATTNQGFQSIIPNKDLLDSYFVFALTKKLKRYGETHGAGSTFVEISGKELAKAPIELPSIKEQKKISLLNHRLDNIIFLQQSRLDKLTHLKRFLLQQMFI